jgi:hypothetical protein
MLFTETLSQADGGFFKMIHPTSNEQYGTVFLSFMFQTPF